MAIKAHTQPVPLVTVVVPLYNAAAHLDKLLASLQTQTFSNFEAILINDGSTDNTFALAQDAAKTDTRFSVLSQSNAGPGVARNIGINIARGTYIAFIDADDTVNARYLEVLVTHAQNEDADITICQMAHHYPAGYETPSPDAWPANKLPASFAPAELADTLFGTFRNWPVDKLFRRAFLDENNIRFPALYRTEDLAFTCSALATAKRIALVNEQLYTYYIYDSGSSTTTRDIAPTDFYESCLVLKKFLEGHGLMTTFANTYEQWVALCCMLNLVELNTREGFNAAYNILHNGGLERLGLRAPRTYLQANPNDIAAGYTPNSEVDAILAIVEEADCAAGLRKLIARGHCGQILKPYWLQKYSFRHPIRSIKRLLKT